MLGSKAIYKSLLKNQVKDVFLYSGGAIMSLVDLFKTKDKPQINYYVNNQDTNSEKYTFIKSYINLE